MLIREKNGNKLNFDMGEGKQYLYVQKGHFEI